ncbi:hypothetical protein [Candidatus Accumulibacter phosphatis]|uniref:Uncharacterized protein n=1 Tax=Candidatus Accumulibacter phosphatis TaxID=327160 RepID=A0A5S4EHR4_9PROT|nr:hypothetical protein [Candidatus Accumulibacter phosphatis]TMQ74821.1 hypothetical protein ACCUM_2897 [Candidatus Accumulibacter phosphatis]
MLKRFVVLKSERAALFKEGDFERILSAGRYYFFDPVNRLSVQSWKLDAPMRDITGEHQGRVSRLPSRAM